MKKSEATRIDILNKAFQLIYANGYQATSIDDILATTKVTKGAFYYHFKNKDEMATAIIQEIIQPTMINSFIEPLKNDNNPLDNIYSLINDLLFNNDFLQVQYGCPTSNLVQEVSPWNSELSQALQNLIDTWQQELIKSIQKGINDDIIKDDVIAEQVAFFTMSGYWGIRNFGKIYNNKDCYHSYLKELEQYLNLLRKN